MRTSLGAAVGLVALFLAGCGDSGTTPLDDGSGPVTGISGSLRVLSNRPDLLSGDDVLVEVVLPVGVAPEGVVMTRNGSIASGDFGLSDDGRYLARVTGLSPGANQIGVTFPNAAGSAITVINHPNGGPVFSGPQVQPWQCQDTAVDEDCNQPAEYSYLYKSTNPDATGLQPYDPDNPPADVATTTTDEGVTLPFIVRLERGYQLRDEYKIFQLFRPGEPWEPWAPQDQWNRKVLIPHGGSCGTDHNTGGAPTDDYSGTIPANPGFEQSYILALGKGFAVVTTALDNLGHDCNLVTAAESLMMAKERLVEQYGTLRYTIGTGCSGGSITQQHVANAYPGIYNGLLTTCAYPDALSTGAQFADFHILRLYFEDPSKWGAGVAWTEQQYADVEGHVAHADAVAADEAFFKSVTFPRTTDAAANCGVPESDLYEPTTNPGGVRCGLVDYMINVLGPRAPAVWSPMEVAAGRGFAGIFAGNAGIQYGLNALRQGKITPAQFVDLNVKVGGVDIDFEPVAQRLVGDAPAVANGYRSGAVNVTNNLHSVAIINFTGPDPGIAHDTVHAWWTRWRLDREQGHHDNHVMWGGPAPLIGDPNYASQSLFAMDRWLAAVEQDAGTKTLAQKIIDNRPEDVHDQCSDGSGHKITDDISCSVYFSTPRAVAGDLVVVDGVEVGYADTMDCELRPMNRADPYGPLDQPGTLIFTDAQWADLQTAFPDGVCDYSKPGTGAQKNIPWLGYGTDSTVIYGGEPLPAAPVGVAPGWASPAFSPPSP
jgi:hypothetical protein